MSNVSFYICISRSQIVPTFLIYQQRRHLCSYQFVKLLLQGQTKDRIVYATLWYVPMLSKNIKSKKRTESVIRNIYCWKIHKKDIEQTRPSFSGNLYILHNESWVIIFGSNSWLCRETQTLSYHSSSNLISRCCLIWRWDPLGAIDLWKHLKSNYINDKKWINYVCRNFHWGLFFLFLRIGWVYDLWFEWKIIITSPIKFH